MTYEKNYFMIQLASFGPNSLSRMTKPGQKILFKRSSFEQHKQILRSALLFLSEPIKTDGNSKGFLCLRFSL